MKQNSCIAFLLLSFFTSSFINAQKLFPVAPVTGETLPAWADMMYSDHPNVWQVDDGYRQWRQSHPDDKTTYTQYYKKWRHAVDPYINRQGFEQPPTEAEKAEFQLRLEKLQKGHSSSRGSQAWSVIGPTETFNTNTGPSPLAKSSQVNVYCFDQSLSNPDVLYCGTEGGEIYKSITHGESWFCVSRSLDIGAPGTIEIDPTNPDIVYAGESNHIQKTTDGGQTWLEVLTADNLYANDIKVNPSHPEIVLAATAVGVYRTEDGGTNWDKVVSEEAYDIEWKTDNDSIAFLVRKDPVNNVCKFYKSLDAGATWTERNNGWFFSNEDGRHDGGARLAVTNADPNRIYALLIGEAKTGDDGFIGIWRSDDAGESWVLPNPPAGGPYDETNHPNMATIGRTGGYQQGFYNLGFDASDSNPDALMAGFLSLWYSTDAAATWTCFGGYCGNPFNYVHPDCQEIEINGGDVWMTSDGGIEYSNDFFQTHYAMNNGITGSDYWGFGTGWNDDILVGGRYHNGNSGQYEEWMPGECLSLGGGEAASGYVNPGEGRKTYFSDIGGVILPEEQNGYAEYFNIGRYPNESYYDAESGEMEWDPRSWNTFFVTSENKIWKTTNGGGSWDTLYSFGNDVNARTMSFEVCRSNPDIMYLFQRNAASWDPGLLWKTEDGGGTWFNLNFPPGYPRRCVLSADAEDDKRIWLAYPDSGDGEKIYTSGDGGLSWENLTTDALNGEHITYILSQGGTNGGIYLGTFRTVWFRTDSMDEWLPYNEALPKKISTCILRPFYRDGKIRMGAYGKSIWEAPFAVSSRPVAQPMADHLVTSCPGDTIHFDDYSMLLHDGATWAWEFPGGTPATASTRNPKVVYNGPGDYDVTLTVSNAFGTSTKTVKNMIHVDEPLINPIPPAIDFSTDDFFTISNPDNGITWSPINLDECNPDGDVAYYVDNYNYSSYGQDEIILPANMDFTGVESLKLHFRVAYAPYYDVNPFIDSLKVLVSNNCEKDFYTVFRSGGEELSTTTSGLGPNNLYENEVFRPASCEEWRHVTLDLDAFAGKYLTIKFRNQSGYGNQMYLDDIYLETILTDVHGITQRNRYHLYPNPTNGEAVLQVATQDQGLIMQIADVTGQIIESRKISVEQASNHRISLTGYPAGVYCVRVIEEKGTTWSRMLVKN